MNCLYFHFYCDADRLDGLAKKKYETKPQTMEDFLQVPDYYNMEDTSGKKRVCNSPCHSDVDDTAVNINKLKGLSRRLCTLLRRYAGPIWKNAKSRKKCVLLDSSLVTRIGIE